MISKTGSKICGGLYGSQTGKSCLELKANGEWATSHTLLYGRWAHTNWRSGADILLIGGHDNPKATELAKADGSSINSFTLKEERM